MKRRLLSYMMLAMLLSTGGVVFANPGYMQDGAQSLESVQQLVACKTQQALSLVKHHEAVNGILLMLAQALLLAGLITIATKKYFLYSFTYTQSLSQHTPQKEKDRRFSWDDVL